VCSIVIGVIIQNLHRTRFQLYPGFETELLSGVLVLLAFGLGALLSFLFLIAFGVKTYFRERALEGNAQRKQAFIDGYSAARALSFLGPQAKAVDAWKKLCKEDPSRFLCRLELARLLSCAGDKKAALAELDAIRAEGISHPEVLYLAATLNRELGNSTAALDNLALLISEHKSSLVAALARDLSRDLGRIDDAIEYHEHVRELNFLDLHEDTEHVKLLVEKAQQESQSDSATLRKALQKISKAHPTVTEPLFALAALELEQKNLDAAANTLQDIGRQLKTAAPWLQAMNIQMSAGAAEKAKSIGRVALRELSGKEKFELEIFLLALEFDSGQLDNTRKLADSLHNFVNDIQSGLSTSQLLRFILLYVQILAATETGKSINALIQYASRGLHAPHPDMGHLNTSLARLAPLGEQELRAGLSPIFSTP
jgi:tetratricopeptide (TPR) repeat protein